MTDSTKKTSARRAPRTFNLDEPAEASKPQAKSTSDKPKPKKRKPKSFDTSAESAATAKLREIPDEAAQRIAPDPISHEQLAAELTPPPPPALSVTKKRFAWGRLFWIALTGLVTLSIGVWVDELITSLFDRNDWLGWLATALIALLVLASLVLALREFWGLSRMARIDRMRQQAAVATSNDDMGGAHVLCV